MPPDLEPASALAARICAGPGAYESDDQDRADWEAEIRERDAAVRAPLETQLSESRKGAEHNHKLYTDLDAEVESALSKLAPFADEGQELTLTELADEAWNSWASTADELKNAAERIASLEAQLASAREEALREAIAAVEAINADHWATTGGIKARALMVLQSRISFVRNAPPAAQKEPSRG